VPTHVVLLRGVNNLGGKKVAMAELQKVATSLGHADDLPAHLPADDGEPLRLAEPRSGSAQEAAGIMCS
jgi:hypothetical protein